MFRSLFRSLLAWSYQSQAHRQVQHFQPKLEALEDRLSPVAIGIGVGTGTGAIQASFFTDFSIQAFEGRNNFVGQFGKFDFAAQFHQGSNNHIVQIGNDNVAIQAHQGSDNTIVQIS